MIMAFGKCICKNYTGRQYKYYLLRYALSIIVRKFSFMKVRWWVFSEKGGGV